MSVVVLLLSSFLFSLCNGQICTSPVYSNSGATVRGPCPSSQVVVPIGSIIEFNCSYNYTGNYLTFWNISNIGSIISTATPPANSGIKIDVGSSGNGFTILTISVTKQELLVAQCGLCNGIDCYQSPLQPTVISLPVQLISFGPPHLVTHQLQNRVVTLYWSPPLTLSDDIYFYYNVSVTDDTNITDYFSTNTTNITIEKSTLTNSDCSQYIWSVSTVVNNSYSQFNQSFEKFTFTSAPNISDKIQVIKDELNNTFLIISVLLQCNNYIYQLLLKDNCGNDINSLSSVTPISINDTLFINITDITVDNMIYFVAIMVKNFKGNDMTEYINIRNESQPFNNITLYDICVSSSLILTSSPSLSSPIVTDTPLKTPSTVLISTSLISVSILLPSSSNIVLSASNNAHDTKHDVIIISLISPTIAIIIMTLIVSFVLICKWKMRCSSEVYHCSDHGSNKKITADVKSTQCVADYLTPQDMSKTRTDYINSQQIQHDYIIANHYYQPNELQGDPTYQTPEKLQTLPQDNVLTTSAYAEPLTDQRTSVDTYYVIPEPAANVIPLPSLLPPPTTPSSQLENVVDMPGYSEVPVNIKKTNCNWLEKGSAQSPKSPLPSLPINDDSDTNGTFLFDNKTSSPHSSDQIKSQGDPTYQIPERLQTLSRDNIPATSAYTELLTDQRDPADTNYATPETAVNVIPLPSPLPPPTTSSPQLENVVDIPGYSEVPVNIKKTNSNRKEKGSIRNPKSPLPSLPIHDDSDNNGTSLFDNTTSSPHLSDQIKNETKDDISTHLYTEMSEIRSPKERITTQYTPIEFTQRDYPTPTIGQQDAVEYASIT